MNGKEENAQRSNRSQLRVNLRQGDYGVPEYAGLNHPSQLKSASSPSAPNDAERFAARVLADSLEEVEALKADAERWTQYAKTGFPTAHYNEFGSARKIKGWQVMIKGKLYSAATANEAADMLIAVRGE